MPPETRHLPGPEDLEEHTFDPTLRIPPLQHPISFLAPRRPLPLEPNARVDNAGHHPTTILNTRAKALADAKPIEDERLLKSSDTHNGSLPEGTFEGPALIDRVTKRQKLDYFQLPKPSTKSSGGKPLSFSTVPLLLNALHEPPPSAALFPPITSDLADETRSHRTKPAATLPSIERLSRDEPASEPAEKVSKKDNGGKPKRVYLRGRRPWTIEETDDLLRGVGIYGVGRWKSILHHKGLRFHLDRTTVDLKDRYRTCRLHEERAMDRGASQKLEEDHEKGQGKPKKPQGLDAKKSSSDLSCLEQELNDIHNKDATPEVTTNQDFDISTPSDFESSTSDKKRHLPRWTPEEDANLSKGYQKYGFQWTAISKDPNMNLGHRTGPQLRDRFRLKYPVHYQASVPLPLPDAAKRTRRRKSDNDPKPSRTKPKPQGSHRQELTWILRDSSEPPQNTASKAPRSRRSDAAKKIIPSSRCNSFPTKYLQSEHDTPPRIQESRFSDVDQPSAPQSTPPASITTGDRSRQTSPEADETRNMNIDDLLNDDSETNSRLPPFKFPFDNDWSNEAISDSVTLAPLLWEDMASRPLFGLE